MRVYRLGLLAGMVLFVAPGAWAQSQSTHVRGTIQSFDGTILTVRKAGGTTESFAVPGSARITYNKVAHLSDIRSGDFVASGGVTQADGKIHAREVRIFPAAMAGLGEGQYPMDTPKSSMTNATVSAVSTSGTVSASGGGGTLAMTFHGTRAAGSDVCTGHAAAPGAAGCTGTTSLVVDPDVPVTALFMGDTSLLKPGLSVSALVAAGPDSKPAARFLTVEKDGIKPVR
jgi:hypothetical protein